MNQPHSREESIFLAAAELMTPELRAGFLDRECANDPALRRRIENLLAAAADTRNLLEAADQETHAGNNSPGPGATGTGGSLRLTSLTEKPGDLIGPYKIREQVGEGGCGVVYVAEQEKPIRRKVALKVIKLGMDTKSVIARFEAERQALAMMDHPNIAKVLDAGTTNAGRPYFVMELVRGIRITDYCDQANLSTKDRLDLFIKVCSAIQHAHQKGIIHRDIKPSNILVTLHDGVPVPKVIDFGIAKATEGRLTEATVYTELHAFVGTPVYMSPEQAEMTGLDIDTRSDIYSLGVLLYELLTGKPPFDAKDLMSQGLDAMRRTIREVEPARPSTRLGTLAGHDLTTLAKRRSVGAHQLQHQLKGDLDWIVMKALEKDRQRRYETANGLAADLKRHLNNDPVVARPPSLGYLLQKAYRRNKLAFAAGAAIAASLVIGIAASVWQAVRATRAEKEATSEATRATATLDELRATAPAFAEQAHGLAAKEQYADAIAKLDYAIKLRPDAAEFLVAKADLLRCQLQLAAAAAIYREALRVKPGHARAGASAKLCDELLAAPPAADGKLSRESLAKLHLAMQKQQRPAAELLPVARLLGEEKKLLLDYWLARLKDLPVSAENPLAQRLTVREDGRLALDLSGTKVTDLSPLAGAPLAVLNLNGSTELTDISPLAGLALIELDLDRTRVTDLTPLREMHSLETLTADDTQVADLTPLSALRLKRLYLRGSSVTDLTPIQKMPLETLMLLGTRVTGLSPLIGMPIKMLDLGGTPVRDFSPLAQMPLEKCYLGNTQIADLTVLRGRPLKELVLYGCAQARNYAVLADIPTLESLILPDTFRTLPDEELAAIGSLRTHPKLRQIQADYDGTRYYSAIQSKDLFWQDWDRLQTFLPALRKSGFKFSLTKNGDRTYGLGISGQPLSDFSFLKGAPISDLSLAGCKITDLTPLRDLSLTVLNLDSNPITDLSPLRGMRLQMLGLSHTSVSDLSPLAGMPLRTLRLLDSTNIKDISPLLEIPTLERLTVPRSARNLELLRKMPNLNRLDFNYYGDNYHTAASTAEDFWKQWDTLTWTRTLIDAGVQYTAIEITEAPPEAATPSGIRKEKKAAAKSAAKGTGLWAVKIESKDFRDCSIFKGADDIRDLNLAGSAVTDLAPLADCKGLQSLILPPDVKDIEFLRAFTQLKRISYREDPKTRQPAQTAKEFWKEYDSQGWLNALRASGVAIKSVKQLPDGTWDLDLTGAAITDLAILKGAPISRLDLTKTAVSDLTALRGWPLQQLIINGTKVADLEPLRGLPLQFLAANGTAVADLEPLRGMALKDLALHGTKVTDLRPLQGMPLETLNLKVTKVTDLSALRGMPLTTVEFLNCPDLTDLSPLAETKGLTRLILPPNAKGIEFLRTFPKLEHIGFNEHPESRFLPDKTAAEFWKEYDQAWLRALRASGVAIKSVKPLKDGTWDVSLAESPIRDLTPLRGTPISTLNVSKTAVADLEPLRGMALKELNISDTKVSDLTPLRGMALTKLFLGKTKVADLSPLKGMPLEVLLAAQTQVTDLTPLRGMPLIRMTFFECIGLSNLSPLAESKILTDLTLPPNAKDIEFLRTFPKLERLGFGYDPKTFLPDKTAAEFWKEYDSQGWLKELRVSGVALKSVKQLEDGTWDLDLQGAAITDLTILKGTPISRLKLNTTAVSDLKPLRGLALKALNLEGTKVTDLTPLQGMPLEDLALNRLPVADLTILRGLPLQKLEVNSTRIADLEPLRGMALKHLAISDTKVTDLQPLKGMPLEYLNLIGTAVTDLSVLRGMPLTNVRLIGCKQLTDLSPLAEAKGLTLLTLPPNAKDIEFLRTFPKLKRLSFTYAQPQTHLPAQTAAEFWKEWDSQGWLRALRASIVAIKSVKQLADGTWEVDLTGAAISDLKLLSGAPISRLWLGGTAISDLAPLRGMALKELRIYTTKVTDLQPLKGMPLEHLNLLGTAVTDLSPLRGMDLILLKLEGCTQLTDLTPLADCKTLRDLTLPPKSKDIDFLRAFPKLERLSFTEDPKNGYRADKTAAEFWKEWDAKKTAPKPGAK